MEIGDTIRCTLLHTKNGKTFKEDGVVIFSEVGLSSYEAILHGRKHETHFNDFAYLRTVLTEKVIPEFDNTKTLNRREYDSIENYNPVPRYRFAVTYY